MNIIVNKDQSLENNNNIKQNFWIYMAIYEW
jgi:hypothetical protein